MRLFALLYLLILPAASGSDAVLFANACASCHGPAGAGNESLRAPSVAGLPAWYVLHQLRAFRAGHRGSDVQEPQAMVMAATVKALPADSLAGLAAYVESLPRRQPTAGQLLAGADLLNGRLLFEERCMECHRYNASGEVVFGSPPLLGLPDWYLLAQMQKFRAGTRGGAPGDAMGAKMANSAQVIATDEMARDVTAYILSLNISSPGSNPAVEPTFGTENPAVK